VALADEYERQERWRAWDQALIHVPAVAGERVLDLGCGVGAVSGRLARRGAEVIGVDADAALLASARRLHPGVRFVPRDISSLEPETFGLVHGIWSSFVAAYFADLEGWVERIASCLAPGGWLALVEVDDLLAHEPRTPELAQEIAEFYSWSHEQGGYGFTHGRRLEDAMREARLTLLHSGTLPDAELAFSGAASTEILNAWRERLARMQGITSYFGPRREALIQALLASLSSPEHRSLCRVRFAVGRVRA